MADNNLVFVEASADEMGDFRAAKAEWSERLLKPASSLAVRAFGAAASPVPAQNVVGVGIGEQIVDGKPTGVRALKFLVRIKYPEGQLDPKNRLPKSVNGLPVDVEQVGEFRRFATATAQRSRTRPPTPRPGRVMPNPRTKIRPAQPGCSIGFRDPNNQFVMAGTFGALVKKDGNLYVLSNNHVLADENQLPVGSPIFQPGLLDGGKPNADQIAELTQFVPLQTAQSNTVDAAIAKALNSSLVSNAILFIGPPHGTATAQEDMIVHKFGRTTGYRVGRVTSIETDTIVGYNIGNLVFENQIIIVGLNGQSFSDAGDSGSLILERRTQRAIGLLFAGSTTHTIANHIQDVLQALNVTLA